MDKCKVDDNPTIFPMENSVHRAPSVSDTLTFAHPNARLKVDAYPCGQRLHGEQGQREVLTDSE